MAATTQALSTFDITSWEQETYDEGGDGPPLARTTVKKTLTGDLQGTSVAELLMCQADEDHAGYVASERVTGRLEGREGSFVLQHGGLVDGETLNPFGHVVPGSGTGDLAGLRGTGIFLHDENGATFTLDYWFVK